MIYVLLGVVSVVAVCLLGAAVVYYKLRKESSRHNAWLDFSGLDVLFAFAWPILLLAVVWDWITGN